MYTSFLTCGCGSYNHRGYEIRYLGRCKIGKRCPGPKSPKTPKKGQKHVFLGYPPGGVNLHSPAAIVVHP